MPKPKYAPPPSSEKAIAELKQLSQISDDEIEAAMALRVAELEALPAPEPETISIGELLLLNVETRINRIATALEAANKIKATHQDDITGLTAQVNRLADAFESMAGFIGCITDSVEGKDGVARCYVRTRDENHGWFLSERDERED